MNCTLSNEKQQADSINDLHCPPPFSILLSVLPSIPPKVVGVLCAQLLLQFYADYFETLQMFLSWSEDMHVVWILSSDYILSFFLQDELCHFLRFLVLK